MYTDPPTMGEQVITVSMKIHVVSAGGKNAEKRFDQKEQ